MSLWAKGDKSICRYCGADIEHDGDDDAIAWFNKEGVWEMWTCGSGENEGDFHQPKFPPFDPQELLQLERDLR